MKKTIFAIATIFLILSGCQGSADNIDQSTDQENKAAIKLILHIDDLGMHQDYDKTALELLEAGLVKTGSIMVPAPHFEEMAKEVVKRDLDVGIHITLTNEWQEKYPWTALLPPEEVPSLYNEQGLLWKNELIMQQQAEPEDVKKEMRAQIERAREMGITLTHMDAHMGCYYTPKFLQVAFDLADEYNIPIAFSKEWVEYYRGSGVEFDPSRFVFIDSFDGIWQVHGQEDQPQNRVYAYENFFSRLRPGIHYMYLHPANVTPALDKIINDKPIRQGDYDILSDPATADYLQELGIEVIGYRDIYEQQLQLR